MSGITCPSCNTLALPGAIFCDFCGYDLRTLAAPPPAAAAQAASQPAQAQADGAVVCPLCKSSSPPGTLFCENCGGQLALPAPVPAPKPDWEKDTYVAAPSTPAAAPAASGPGKIAGRLLVKDSQEYLTWSADKSVVVLGRDDPVSGVFPDVDLDPYGGHEAGVGRRHAQLVWKDGQVCLEDLDSVNGTAVNRVRLTAHQLQPLKAGDEILLGKLCLVYSL